MLVLYIMAFPSISFAQPRGISGLIQTTYQRYTTEEEPDAGSETRAQTTTITQNYSLKYRGFIYHPRLLSYTLGGAFQRTDTKSSSSTAEESTARAKLISSDFRVDLLQGTKMPFSVYKDKVKSEQTADKKEEQTADRYGITGFITLPAGPTLRYDASMDKTVSSDTDKRNRNFMFGMSHSNEQGFIDTSYAYRDSMEKTKGEFEASNDINASFGLKPTKDTRFDAKVSYADNSFTEFTTISSNANFNYMPSPDFSSSLNLYINRVELKEESGNFSTLYGNSTYRVSPYVTTSQNLMIYRSSGDFGEEFIQNLSAGAVFTKPMPWGLTFSANASVNGYAQQSQQERDKKFISYTVGSEVSRLFNLERINSTANTAASYSFYRSSLGGRSTRYTLNAGFTGRFIQNLTLQSLLNYSEDETLADAVEGTAQWFSRSRILTSDNSLAYFLPIGFKGGIDAKAGAIFMTGTTRRTFQYINSNFQYAVWRNLLLNAGANISKDGTTDTIEISGNTGVEYSLRKVSLSLRQNMTKEIRPHHTRNTAATFLQVSRFF